MKQKDGRKDNLNRKKMVKDYIEDEVKVRRIFCVHQLTSDENFNIPIDNQTLGLYLNDLVEEGLLEDKGKGECWKSYKHPKYQKIPKEQREKALKERKRIKKLQERKFEGGENLIDEKPGYSSVWKSIREDYEKGDTFTISDIKPKWVEKHRDRITQVIYDLTNKTNLMKKAGEKGTDGRGGNQNLYEVVKENYEDRYEEDEDEGEIEERKKEKETTEEKEKEAEKMENLYKMNRDLLLLKTFKEIVKKVE